jgi:hypothetical protein
MEAEDEDFGSIDDKSASEVACPLFMEGLPKNFDKNPHLAALASLLEDADEETHRGVDSETKTAAKAGISKAGGCAWLESRGGRVRVSKSRDSRKGEPYRRRSKQRKEKEETSLGEAQLFLKMWKLN